MTTQELLLESQQVQAEADCLFAKHEVLAAVSELAKTITKSLSETNPVVISVMNGGMVPMGLLMTELEFPLQMDYIHATRYRDKTRGGQLDWLVSPRIDLRDRTVLLIDDIHDEGVTLQAIKNYCQGQGAQQVLSAVLVNKVHERKNNSFADFVALDVPDRYVFGFGMDYKGMLRNAPGIYAVKGL